jgi:hypothetical protein
MAAMQQFGLAKNLGMSEYAERLAATLILPYSPT